MRPGQKDRMPGGDRQTGPDRCRPPASLQQPARYVRRLLRQERMMITNTITKMATVSTMPITER
jgi:hypothetical protein